MNKNQARQLLGSIIQELEAGTMFIEDLGQKNITELLNLVRPSNKHTESSIQDALKTTVKPHLFPANTFMQVLRESCEVPEAWENAIHLSKWIGNEENEMEVQQFWFVMNERLRLLMTECGCEFLQLEELHIWLNASSKCFGSLAMDKLGRLLLDGVYDRHFIRRIMADGKTDIQHYLGDNA